MTTTNKFIGKMIFLFLGVLTFTACSPEDGKDGEQGPMGNANVIYSNWVSFPQAARDTVIDGTNLKVNHFTAQGLTQDIIDSGSIQVFIQFGTTTLPLPYTSRAGNRTSTVSFTPRPNRMYVTRHTHDNNSPQLGFGSVQFRYILIPGNISATSKLRNIDYSELSYKELCDMFNIPE